MIVIQFCFLDWIKMVRDIVEKFHQNIVCQYWSPFSLFFFHETIWFFVGNFFRFKSNEIDEQWSL